MTRKIENARKAKLDKILTKLAMFIVEDTFTDEPEVQDLIGQAIGLCDKAIKIMVANDEKADGGVKS